MHLFVQHRHDTKFFRDMHLRLAVLLATVHERYKHSRIRIVYRNLSWGGRNIRGQKGSPYSITERRVPELIQVLCSQPANDVSHKPGV